MQAAVICSRFVDRWCWPLLSSAYVLLGEPVWTDPLSVIVPTRHPLFAHTQVHLAEALKFPLVMFHPDAASGCHDQIQAVLEGSLVPLKVVDHVASLGVMLTLVGAGYGIAFGIASQVQAPNRPDIATRPLAGRPHCSRPICCAGKLSHPRR